MIRPRVMYRVGRWWAVFYGQDGSGWSGGFDNWRQAIDAVFRQIRQG